MGRPPLPLMYPCGLKLLLVARQPVCEQAAEQRAGRRLRRVVVAAKVPVDGTEELSH
jgi:hypothetical protein